jgi:hypothetical protein
MIPNFMKVGVCASRRDWTKTTNLSVNSGTLGSRSYELTSACPFGERTNISFSPLMNYDGCVL